MPSHYPHARAEQATEGTLHPISFDRLAHAYSFVQTVDSQMLEAFVEQREHGRPDDMLTILYDARLDGWHEKNNRLGSPLYYKAGQLYGYLAYQGQYRDVAHERLIPDAQDAYRVADATVRSSYDARKLRIDDEDYLDFMAQEQPWAIEKLREFRQTGFDVLSVLNAALTDRIHDQLAEMSGNHQEPNEMTMTSFLRGMIDAAIFVRTYVGFRDGHAPEWHIVPDGWIAPHVDHFYDFDMTRGYSTIKPEVVSLSSTDSLRSIIGRLSAKGADGNWKTMVAGGVEYSVYAQRQMIQTGINEFTARYSVPYVEMATDQPYPWQVIYDAGRMPRDLYDELAADCAMGVPTSQDELQYMCQTTKEKLGNPMIRRGHRVSQYLGQLLTVFGIDEISFHPMRGEVSDHMQEVRDGFVTAYDNAHRLPPAA